MKPEHLSLLRIPGRPSVDPGGEWAVVAVSRPDVEADTYPSRLWRIDLETGDAVALTAGPKDSQPVVSPDGRWIAFLRGGDSGPQLALLDTRGGEARVITSHRLGLSGRPVWSPDSSRLAYVAGVAEEGRYGTAEGVGPDAEPARHITTLTYRVDNEGFTIGRPDHVHVVTVPAPSGPADGVAAPVIPVRLTDGDLAYLEVAWLPDGAGLMAIRDRHDALVTDLVRLSLPDPPEPSESPEPSAADNSDETPEAKAARERRERDGDLVAADVDVIALALGQTVDAVACGDDGTLVLAVRDFGADELDFVGKNSTLARATLGPSGLGELDRLSDPDSDDLEAGVGSGSFHELPDGRVLARRIRRGRTELVAVGPDGIDVLHRGSVTGADVTVDGRIVASVTLPDSPGEVVVLDPSTDGPPRVLTDLAAPLRAGVETAGLRLPTEVVDVAAPDGHPVHGWLVLPDAEQHGPGPYPVLLNIHGGPYAAYEDVFFDEVQVYAGAGYAVVYGNPRGGAGYGSEHGRSILNRWGTIDADDVLALLDAAVAAHPELDATRVGVMGGSYGGYLTAWLTTRSDAADRFRGAIVERGFVDPVSFEGSSDIGWFFGGRYLGEDPDVVAAQSPMARIGNVVTPTLVIHSEQDWRCPVEQGQRWYVGLKRRGVETELLLFPGEGHELSRSGRPKHRVQRFEAILDWWERHLR